MSVSREINLWQQNPTLRQQEQRCQLNRTPTRVSPFTANPYNLSLDQQSQMFSEKA
jgi:hypothetical protein